MGISPTSNLQFVYTNYKNNEVSPQTPIISWKFIFNYLFPKGDYIPKSRFCQVKFPLQIFILPSPTSAVGDFLFFLNFFHFLVRKLPKNLLINKNNCPAHDTKPSKSPFTILSKRKVKNYDKKTELKTTQTWQGRYPKRKRNQGSDWTWRLEKSCPSFIITIW